MGVSSHPPLARTTGPLMAVLAADARKTTIGTTSAGVSSLPIGLGPGRLGAHLLGQSPEVGLGQVQAGHDRVGQDATSRELLRSGVTPAEAAAALGYCDQSQLHRHCVRIVGTTRGLFASSECWRRGASITPIAARSPR
jgi:hypothetical protein